MILWGKKYEIKIYPIWGFMIKYLLQGYNDYELPLLIFHFIFGAFYITFPWKHKIKVEAGHDVPTYGIYYSNKAVVICKGKKLKFIYMPYSYDWIRTSLLLKNGKWEHETKENRKTFYEEPWLSKQLQFVIPYKHKTANEGDIDLFITCHIKEREWRQKWLKWTKIGAKIKKILDVTFSEEVGKRRGSWKGGVLGTGFIIPIGGTYFDALKDMEKQYDMYSPILERYKKIKKILG